MSRKRRADKLVKQIRKNRADRKAASSATMNASTPSQRANAYRKSRMAADKTRRTRLKAEYFTGAKKPFWKK